MSLMAVMGRGLPGPSDEDSEGGEPEKDSGDDQDLSELGAKYMERLSAAMKEEDWAGAYKAFCRLNELHSYEEDQERGY